MMMMMMMIMMSLGLLVDPVFQAWFIAVLHLFHMVVSNTLSLL